MCTLYTSQPTSEGHNIFYSSLVNARLSHLHALPIHRSTVSYRAVVFFAGTAGILNKQTNKSCSVRAQGCHLDQGSSCTHAAHGGKRRSIIKACILCPVGLLLRSRFRKMAFFCFFFPAIHGHQKIRCRPGQVCSSRLRGKNPGSGTPAMEPAKDNFPLESIHIPASTLRSK